MVTNTTPLITLAGIELLDLLPHLYSEMNGGLKQFDKPSLDKILIFR